MVDQWSFYKDGVEVYREMAAKPGKKDQFRWLNTAGTRWGVDTVGNGQLTAWKVISAEEATAEIVAAVANRDSDRFARVLLTDEELTSLGLGKAKREAVADKLAKAVVDFRGLADRQKTLTPASKWLQFSGGRPGTVPAGTEESTRDINVYENVVAIAETEGKQSQVQIGTLVHVGNTWKAIDAPVISEGQAVLAATGLFLRSAQAARAGAAAAPSEELQKMIAALEGLDPGDPRRLEIIQKIIDQAKTPEERTTWLKNLADTLSAGLTSGKLPDAEKRLLALEEAQKENDKNLAAYVKIRLLTANYARAISAPKADVTEMAKIQSEWPKSLEQFISDYPASPDTAEALLQLGMAREYSGHDDDAKKSYERIVREFADAPQAKKAAGAVRRIDSVGTVLELSGKGINGEAVDLASYRGKVVLVQYWATYSESAKTDMAALKKLVEKYRGSFNVLGVSLDGSAKALKDYLAENPLPWSQIYEEGGQDSRPATTLGIISVPTMILVDAQGKVVNRNIQASEVEAELKKPTH